MIKKINRGSSSANGSLSSSRTSRLIGKMGKTTGRMWVGEDSTVEKGIRRRAVANLCLFVRWSDAAWHPQEIWILYTIVGLAHPEYIVTERRKAKIYRGAAPTRQNPSTIPGDVHQSAGLSLMTRRQPVIQTCNPGFLIFAKLGGKSRCRVFLEEREKF